MVCAPIPCFGLTAQLANISDPASSQTLATEKTDLYLGLIQPASMGRSVMDSESPPDFSGHFGSEHVRQRLLAMDIEIVHHQVNRLGARVCQGQANRYLSELETRTIRRGEREVPTGLRLYGAENLAVSQRWYSLSGLASRPD